MDYFCCILHSSDSVLSVHEQKTVLKKKIYELQSLVDAARDSDALCTAKQHIVTAINSLKAMESYAHENSNMFSIRKRPASNAKSEKQLHFHSTKKKQVTQKRDGQNQQQKKSRCVVRHLSMQKQDIVGYVIEDDTGPSGTVLWIQCSECNI